MEHKNIIKAQQGADLRARSIESVGPEMTASEVVQRQKDFLKDHADKLRDACLGGRGEYDKMLSKMDNILKNAENVMKK